MRPIDVLEAQFGELVEMAKGKRRPKDEVAAEMARRGLVEKKVPTKGGRMVTRWVREDEAPVPAPKMPRKRKATPTAPIEAPAATALPTADELATALRGIDWAGPTWRVEADPDGHRVHASWGLVYTGYIDIGSTHPLASYDRLTPSARIVLDSHLATAGFPVESLVGSRPSPDQAALEWARETAKAAQAAVKGLKAKPWHGSRYTGKHGASPLVIDKARVYLTDFGGSKRSPKRDLGYIERGAPDPYATVDKSIRELVRQS